MSPEAALRSSVNIDIVLHVSKTHFLCFSLFVGEPEACKPTELNQYLKHQQVPVQSCSCEELLSVSVWVLLPSSGPVLIRNVELKPSSARSGAPGPGLQNLSSLFNTQLDLLSSLSAQVPVSPEPFSTPSWPSPSSSPAAATPTWSTASSTGWDQF